MLGKEFGKNKSKFVFRLRRARTMTCGAIFFDEEEPDDSPSGNAFMDETKDEELMDAEEDQLMQQVVFATQMKHELLRTVQNLQSSSSEQDYRPIEHEFTVKPSVLRRLSHSSALLHFENIAKMKRRKSLTEQEMVQAIKEENEEPIVDTNTVSKSNVASLSEVFLRRSKKHVQDYARRRTVNDEKLKNFEIRAFDKDIVQNQDYLSVTRTYSEVPQYINVLETGDIVEKVNNENQIANAVLMASESTTIPMGDDKPVESKEIVTIDKAVVASSTNDDGDPQRELSSGETDHPKIGNLNRSFSLSTVCKPSRMKYQSSSTDSQIVEALDLDSSFHEADFEIVKTVSVADLVHFHDQMILDKKEKNDLKTKKNKQQFDENEIKTIGTNEISSNELNVENQSDQKNINPLRNKVQRVQSLPWYKSSELGEIPDKANALEDVVESRSLPASPRSEENVENPNPLTKHSIMAYLGIGEDERPEKGVRNLVFNFERQKRESEQPSILFVSKLKASEKVTLETSDETNI